jgi:ethanolamine ammonia-lyase large subunit
VAARDAAERVGGADGRSPSCRSSLPAEARRALRGRRGRRLILDGHDAAAFAPIAHLTVGGFRDWLLSDASTAPRSRALAPGLTPEMAAAVSKLHAQPGPVAWRASAA